MNLALEVAQKPICVLLGCPTAVAKAIKREFFSARECADESADQAPFCFVFEDLPSSDPTQALAGLLHRRDDRYFSFDRNGLPFELPFAGGAHRPRSTRLSVSPNISAGFFVPNVLLPVLHLALTRRGASLVHAAAIQIKDAGVLLPAWGGTGKTSVLISLLRDFNCDFLADDLGILTSDGYCHRLGNTINVLDYNLRAYPDLRTQFALSGKVAAVSRSLLLGLRDTLARSNPDSTIAGAAGKLAADAKALANAKVQVEYITRGRTPQSCSPLRYVVALERSGGRSLSSSTVTASDLSSVCAVTLKQEFAKFYTAYEYYRCLLGTQPLEEFEQLQDRTRRNIETGFAAASVNALHLPLQWDDYRTVATRIIELVRLPNAAPPPKQQAE